MSGQDDVTLKSVESDKQSEVKEPADNPQIDSLSLMEQGAEQAKTLVREYANGTRQFTFGDGGFSESLLAQVREQAEARLGTALDDKSVHTVQERPAEAAQALSPGMERNLSGQAAEAQSGGSSVEKVGDNVTKVTYPNGRKLEFDYGADGKVSKVTDPVDGDRWEKQQDGSWKHLDKKGNEIPAQPGDLIDPRDIEDISVNDQGGITTFRRDGSYIRENPDLSVDTYVRGRTIFAKPDGSEEEVHDNGVLVERSADGKVEIQPKPWGPEANKWHDFVPPKDHATYRDDPPGTKYYQHEDGQTLSVYPDGSYSHKFRSEDGRYHEVTYNPGSGNITDSWVVASEGAPLEKISVTRDRDGKESRTRAVWDERTKSYQQVDPPPPLPPTPTR